MNPEFRDLIDDPDSPVIDINGAGSTILSFLVEENGSQTLKHGSDENILLYLHGMRDFLDGETGAVLSKDPLFSVKATSGESIYRIQFRDRAVESMPNQADDVLKALRVAKEEQNPEPLLEIFQKITDEQVRRDVVNKVLKVLPNLDEDRIEVDEQGWVVDGFYVVDWTASLYTKDDGKTYALSGRSGVRTLDKSHEFTELRDMKSPGRKVIRLDGEKMVLGEKEMLFLSKAQWVLKRTQYHPDESFWRYTENYRKKYLRGDT